jgi:hypothetical protein
MKLSELITITEMINDKHYLYHAATAQIALQIIQSKHLKGLTPSRIPVHAQAGGVSLTRNNRYAHTGSDDAGRRSAKVGGETIGTDVVFVFNADVLKQRKQINPVAQSMNRQRPDQVAKASAQTEYEEFALGDIPLDPKFGYLGFYINNPRLDHQIAYQLKSAPGFMYRSPVNTNRLDAKDARLATARKAQQAQQAQPAAPAGGAYDWKNWD